MTVEQGQGESEGSRKRHSGRTEQRPGWRGLYAMVLSVVITPRMQGATRGVWLESDHQI